MQPSTMTNSRLANLAAQQVLSAYERYDTQFRAITQRARSRFEQRDWHGAHADAAERLDLYRAVLDDLVLNINNLLGERVNEKQIWSMIKAVYSALIVQRHDGEIAETFFNSLTRRIFTTVGVDHDVEFVHTDLEAETVALPASIATAHTPTPSAYELVDAMLERSAIAAAYANRAADCAAAAARIDAHLAALGLSLAEAQIETLDQPFFRNKAAYLIGRITHGSTTTPLVLALLHDEGGVHIDAVLLSDAEVAVLSSFTRAYFQVEVERPYDLVQFLHSLMPRKRIAELYLAIGYHKHGKTELYRDLLHHLEASNDQFTFAPGVRGMVMLVFTLPSYDLVFKIIKDQFDAPKNSTRRDVMAKYDLVFQHDRAGRLIDAYAFEHIRLQRERFAPKLLEALQQQAGSIVHVNDDSVTISHVYIERRVTPLDMYVREVGEAAQAAVVDYGQAIKDLAASNIFPGDMLLKNFGVTRHGRIVFYDYDELAWLCDCVFRTIPPPSSYDEEWSSEPWFSVGEHDIFPEELSRFLGLQGNLREAFLAQHADLFATPFWHAMQQRIRAGVLPDIFPYTSSRRLHHGQYIGDD